MSGEDDEENEEDEEDEGDDDENEKEPEEDERRLNWSIFSSPPLGINGSLSSFSSFTFPSSFSSLALTLP